MRMVRKPLNLLVDEDLVKKARNHGLVISKFLENQLRGYFDFIEGRHNNFSQSTNKNDVVVKADNDKMGLLRFELKSIAPEATRMPSYPTGPCFNIDIKNL